MWLKMDLAVAFFFAQFFMFKVRGLVDCPYDVANVVAGKTPKYLLFNQTLEPLSLVCMWPIKSNYFDTRVQLNFPHFHLIHSSLANKGDCVDIYDGSENRYQADLVDTICNRPPAKEYNSTGRYLTVVFRQGDLLGTRWFSMNYSTIAKSDEKGEEENAFFASLVGRLVSFAILLTILSSCSAILRRGRRSSNNLQNCCLCIEECLVGVQVCICNFFLWLWSGVRAASQRLCACVGAAFTRSETGNGEEETADRPRSPDHTFTTITTITANSAPDLTDVVTDRRPRSSSTSSENSTLSSSSYAQGDYDYNAPPPSYFSVGRRDLPAIEAPPSGADNQRDAGGRGVTDLPPPPEYSSLFTAGGESEGGREGSFSTPPPTTLPSPTLPPDDFSAPPTYSVACRDREADWEEEDPFFETAVGRLFSFFFICGLVGTCSALLRRQRSQDGGSWYRCLGTCVLHLLFCIYRFFRWLWSGVRAASQRLSDTRNGGEERADRGRLSEDADISMRGGGALRRSETRTGGETADRRRSSEHAGISTLTTLTTPDLTRFTTSPRSRSSSTSSETSTLSSSGYTYTPNSQDYNYNAPPPSYFSVNAPPPSYFSVGRRDLPAIEAPPSGADNQRDAGGGGVTDLPPPPEYLSLFTAGGESEGGREGSFSTPPPTTLPPPTLPPDDFSAPPTYSVACGRRETGF